MRLTIIPSDGAVYIDKVAYLNLNMDAVPTNIHALQWFDTDGWVEYKNSVPNEQITELPEWANVCIQEWEAADYERKHPPPPPTPTAEQNKETAVELLSATDWSVLPGVADPLQSNPYLANQTDFVIYRNEVRQVAVNPVGGDIAWPEKPQAVWVNV